MSFSQILDELPGFTFEERQLLFRRVIELDDAPLSEAEENLVESPWLPTIQIPPALHKK